MKRLMLLLGVLLFFFQKNSIAKQIYYTDFNSIYTAIPLYHTEDEYFRKGLSNKNLTDTECLSYIMYTEARGESDEGQIAVAFVIKNRATLWNKSLCQIVRQPGEFETKLNKLYNNNDKLSWWHVLNIAFFLNEQGGYDTVNSPIGDAIYFNSLTFEEQSVMGRGRFRGKIGHHYFYGAKRNDRYKR